MMKRCLMCQPQHLRKLSSTWPSIGRWRWIMVHSACKFSDESTPKSNLPSPGNDAHNELSPFSAETEKLLQNMPPAGQKLMCDLALQVSRLKEIKPILPPKSASVASYVNHSDTLQKLLKLGVDLSKFDQDPEVASKLMKADFRTACQPYIVFYHSLGIPSDSLGDVITRYPRIFFEHMDDLQVRKNYFLSKKFTMNDLSTIVQMHPNVLAMSTTEIDSQLGFLQKLLNLRGNELRSLVSRCPKLIVWKNRYVMSLNKDLMKDLLEFKPSEIKGVLMEVPTLAMQDPKTVQDNLDFLLQEMKIPMKMIVQYPLSLYKKHHKMRVRHKYLMHLGRNQYDPTLPNYVSLPSLIEYSDEEFCEKCARVSLKDFNAYLRTQ